MTISLTEVAELTGGKITGDENIKITNLAKIEDANPGELTFYIFPLMKNILPLPKLPQF